MDGHFANLQSGQTVRFEAEFELLAPVEYDFRFEEAEFGSYYDIFLLVFHLRFVEFQVGPFELWLAIEMLRKRPQQDFLF